MSRIGKIYQEKTRDGNLVYPQTVSEAVIDSETGQNVKRVLENIKEAAGLGEGYSWTPVAGGDSIKEDIENLSSGKVDKVTGKVLSDNNYTTAEKSKVGNLPENTILELSGKQGMLTPGDGIDITGGVISATDLKNAILEIDEVTSNALIDLNNRTSTLEEGSVRYDQEQSLENSQKAQARTNIGAASQEKVDEDIQSLNNSIDAFIHPQTPSTLPELCGQPMILFGNGVPQESIVPINWKQYDQYTDTGYNWNGLPSALGQQYINTAGGTAGRYIAVKDGEYKLKWQNC